jgi:hypothetical protein
MNSSTPQTWVPRRYVVVIINVLAALWLCTAALAQNEPTQSSPERSSPQSPDTQVLSKQERDAFRTKMEQIAVPGKGCFTAKYPDASWKSVQCGQAPKTPNPVARGANPFTVGAGTDYFIQVTGNISAASGSFDSVTGVTSEYGPRYDTPSTVHPNTYSLQLNANEFSTTVCGGAPSCVGWEQFLFSQSQCSPSACIFIEFWLINHGSPCPTAAWSYYAGTPTTVPGCYMNTAFASVPVQSLANLAQLTLSGSVSGGLDVVKISTPNGDINATAQDSILNLAQGWTGGEYNLVGDCCDFEAFFNSGSNITVRLSANNGTTNAPTYTTSFLGATAERNNLSLVGSPTPVGGVAPAIVFREAGGGQIPPGFTVGDPHLTTFHGAHYDFQASGDFVLAQADPDLIVQARQKPWSANPNVAVNTGVGIKMGDSRVTVCLSGVEVNGVPTQIPDGATLPLTGGVTVSRRGGTYVASRPSGDVIQAQLMGSYIDVSVTIGLTNPRNVRGLLGDDGESGLVMRNGTKLRAPITWDTWRRYADSWRVAPKDSLLCHGGQVPPGMPQKPTTVEDLKPDEREKAEAICTRAGVSRGPLLNDCMLDVTLLGNPSAADVFVYAPKPKTVVMPLPPP